MSPHLIILRKISKYHVKTLKSIEQNNTVIFEFKDILKRSGYINPTNIDYVTQTILDFFNTTKEKLTSKTKGNDDNFVRPRHFIFYFQRKINKLTLAECGAIFKKDHATVLHGIRRIENGIDKRNIDMRVYRDYQELIKLFNHF